MTIRLSILTLLLSMCFLACTSTNKVISAKEHSNTIIGKWYVTKIESSKGEQEELEFNAFMEFFDDGKLVALLDDEIEGSYELTKKYVVLSDNDEVFLNFEIQSISETDLILVTHQETGDYHFYLSKYSMMNKPSTSTERAFPTAEYPTAMLGKWNVIKTFLSDGDLEEFEEGAFMEFFQGGIFNSLLDDEIEGNYALSGNTFILSTDEVSLSVDIIYLSATHFNFIVHLSKDDDDKYYFFTSKYNINDKRSIFK